MKARRLNFRVLALLVVILIELSPLPAQAISPWLIRLKNCALSYVGLNRRDFPPLRSDPRTFPDVPYRKTRRKNLTRLIQKKYKDAAVDYLTVGGESMLFRVTPHHGKPFILRFPTGRKIQADIVFMTRDQARLTVRRYRQELGILKGAEAEDPEGARYLVHSTEMVDLGNPEDVGIKTEPISGRSLEENIHIFGANASDRDLLVAFREIALGIRALHRAGWIHQDLKPGNVMVRDKVGGGVQMAVGDLGFAAPKGGKALGIGLGMVSGTIPYMSIEQRIGGDAQPRFDIHSMKLVFQIMQKGVPWNLNPSSLDLTPADRQNHPGVARLFDEDFDDFHSVDEVIAAIDRQLARAR